MEAPTQKETYRRRLHAAALDHYGYVTTKMALEMGVPSVELPKLALRGGLTRIAYGIYRFDDIPATRRDAYMEAVLRVGPGAYLVRETVLELHDLALVNPRRLKVGTARRIQATIPKYIEVVPNDLEAGELTIYEGIPATTVARALLDCKETVMHERLVEATHQAQAEGLLQRREAEDVLARIGG
jgi:predicted transcriptional regulator of viral defense system